jgi:hypothetical protein
MVSVGVQRAESAKPCFGYFSVSFVGVAVCNVAQSLDDWGEPGAQSANSQAADQRTAGQSSPVMSISVCMIRSSSG